MFDIVILKLACGIIFRTDNFKLVLFIRKNHGFNTRLTKSMAAHTQNSWGFLLAVLEIAQRA